MSTKLCDLLGIEVPIVQAPIGNVCSVELVSAVCEAGGLGMVAASWRTPTELRTMIREIQARTRRPFGVNLVLQWPEAQHDLLTVCLEEGVQVISFFWGDPGPFMARIDDGSVHVMQTIGSAAEAKVAVERGVDAVVAQGLEAGGHVWGRVSTMALVPAVVDAVGDAPVVAAGGIGDARGIAAALALGASGVWMGSRFVATLEADAHPDYKQLVVDAAETGTVYTTLFDQGWPNAPHRVLRNSTVALSESANGSRPGESDVLGRSPDGTPIGRYADAEPLAATTGEIEAMSLYAGQSSGVIYDIPPAAELVTSLWRDACRLLAPTSAAPAA